LRRYYSAKNAERSLQNSFSKLPSTAWDDPIVARSFFDSIRKEAGLWNLEDFYGLSNKQIMSFGGSGILTRFGFSVRQALQHAYPEHEWLEWRFSRAGSNFWNDIQNQRAFMDWVGKELGTKIGVFLCCNGV
jgi:hypothetical protein